ncbi:MAG: hypothetical protein SGI73_17480 [Chloroflexota bacterium]|nr:hypothetical protein [Chloroflexota bacterium]
MISTLPSISRAACLTTAGVLVLLCAFIAASVFSAPAAQTTMLPTLDDWWDGRATWVVDVLDTGLPIGESDTVVLENGDNVSYLHASDQSAGVRDSCGDPVSFPGCMTRWTSTDGGRTFALPDAVCAIPCAACPCDDARDHITAQQYPRVAFADDEAYLVYEWHAQTMLRTSFDGVTWGDWTPVRAVSGTYPSSFFPCSAVERIGAHPNIRGEIHDCLVGAPPGIYVDGDLLYVFVAAGSAPGHMRCYKGERARLPASLRRCATDPLFGGAREYGALDARGADANPYFDFRYVSSADVLRVGDRYYMSYEGVRGPDALERGMDTQFGLGFARSLSDQIDGAWEKYAGNPVLFDVGFNVGVGHADLIVVDGVTLMYTATSETTRGRYRLEWAL